MHQTHPEIRPRPGLLDIPLYVGGESRLPGAGPVLKLSSNENPHGPSPRALAAYREAADRLALYPDSSHETLRRAIAEMHGLAPDRIICGNGSDEILTLLAQAYAGPGDEVIHTEHGFAMYPIAARAAGATPVAVPERDRRTDVDAILAACTGRTRLVYIANPNNPTGTMIGPDEVARLAAGLPPGAILVLDGAYAEYVDAPGFDAGRALVDGRDNVVMTRTFSKIHGLAGLRVGWGYGPDHIIAALMRLRGPFNVSLPALAAATEAIRDRDWVERCARLNARWRDWLAAALARAGVPSDPSHANFILARFPSPEIARACDAALRADGIIVRRVDGYGFPAALRITIGDEAACRRVAHSVARFMDQA
ncbi:MAG: histidinol-phosphate aminotransferase [Paracoccaceae bacterium]|nr:MAG: histidinol-phosphate aminotransferase [Paracoccaceae bacterium]